jgi:broad specificity phosphatase PhoE
MKIYLIRHGATGKDAFLDPPLNTEGYDQMQYASQQIQSSVIRRIITSPTLRTLESAYILNKHLGGHIPIQTDIRLKNKLLDMNSTYEANLKSILQECFQEGADDGAIVFITHGKIIKLLTSISSVDNGQVFTLGKTEF